MSWFNTSLRRNVYIKNVAIIVNKISIVNCKFMVLLYVTILCSLMYPWFMNLFYRNYECTHFNDVASEHCIKIFGISILKFRFQYFNQILKF